MSYLIDTNVISELIKLKPNIHVIDWLNEMPEDHLFISVLTLGEIRKGVELMKVAQKKEKLRIWLEDALPKRFKGRILPVDQFVCETWGKLLAKTSRSLPAIDSLIAATAIHHRLALVTRNIADFEFSNLDTINPWRN